MEKTLVPGARLLHAKKGQYTVAGKVRMRDPKTHEWVDGIRYQNDSGEEFVRAVDDFESFQVTPPRAVPMLAQQPDEAASPEELLMLDLIVHAAKTDSLHAMACRDGDGNRGVVLGTVAQAHDERLFTPLALLFAENETNDLEPIIGDNLSS